MKSGQGMSQAHPRAAALWVAHASRVLAMTSSPPRTSLVNAIQNQTRNVWKVRFGGAPKPARETRALPNHRRATVRVAYALQPRSPAFAALPRGSAQAQLQLKKCSRSPLHRAAPSSTSETPNGFGAFSPEDVFRSAGPRRFLP